MNVSLPSSLHDLVLAQVAKGGYGSVSEYIGELVRADCAQASFESEVVKGIESGNSTPMTPEDWTELRDRVERASHGG